MYKELIYEPNIDDRDRWERSMFQIRNAPEKLSGWQDYFVRIKQGEDLFPMFLHHYEPVLNSIAEKHISRYSLEGHFADVKMVYVETLLAELEQVYAIDTFQWYSGAENEDGQDDIPFGIDFLGHCRKPEPESALIHKETVGMLHRVFWKLDYKEQDIVSRYLGFYKTCFRPLFSNTFEELADLYQYTTADGVMRFYHRTLDKLRILLDQEGMFKAVRLQRKKKTAKKLIYAYTPSDEGTPGMIKFEITNGIVQDNYRITKAETDNKDMRIGHSSARLLLKLAQQNALPTDRVLPLRNIHFSKEKLSL